MKKEIQFNFTYSGYERILNEYAKNNGLLIEPLMGAYQKVFKTSPYKEVIKINVEDRERIIIDDCDSKEKYAEKLTKLLKEQMKVNKDIRKLINKLEECNLILSALERIEPSFIGENEIQDVKDAIEKIEIKMERYD